MAELPRKPFELPAQGLTDADRAALEPRFRGMLSRPRKSGPDDAFSLLWFVRGQDGEAVPTVWRPVDAEDRRLADLFHAVANRLGPFAPAVAPAEARGDEEVAFVRAILDDREEVTGYLAYADFLTERGDPGGEVIRLSVELELEEDDDRREELWEARDEWLAEHGEHIFRGLTALGLRPELTPDEFVPLDWLDARGVIGEVVIDHPGVLPEHADRLFAAAPFLRKIAFNVPFDPAGLAAVAQLAQIEELNLSGTRLIPARLETLLRSPHLTGLKTLDLRTNPLLGDTGAEVVCAWPGATRLTELRLTDCQLTAVGVAALANCPRLRQLKWLEANAPGPAASPVFRSPYLSNLEHLRLGSEELPPAVAAAVLAGRVQLRTPPVGPEIDRRAAAALHTLPTWKALHTLELGHASFGPGAFAEFARADLPALELLALNSVPLGAAELQALVSASFQPSLLMLVLENCDLGDEGVEALLGVAHPQLQVLDLSRNHIGTRGAVALARAAKRLPNLRRLLLWGNSLGPAAITRLAESRLLADLTELDLRGNDIGTAGALALAETEYLADVVHLRLDAHAVGDEGRAALDDAFQSHVLEFAG